MKKIFTIAIASLFILSFNLKLLSQCVECNNPEYTNKKAQFWKEYELYKVNAGRDINTPKPIDPSGLFYIDENNNFNVKTSQRLPWNNFSAIYGNLFKLTLQAGIHLLNLLQRFLQFI